MLIECRSCGGERFCGLLRRRKSESLTIECTRRGAKLAMASRLGTYACMFHFFSLAISTSFALRSDDIQSFLLRIPEHFFLSNIRR